MRLEDDVNPLVSALTRSSERGADLGWMVAVIINHVHSVCGPLEVEAAIDSAEVF